MDKDCVHHGLGIEVFVSLTGHPSTRQIKHRSHTPIQDGIQYVQTEPIETDHTGAN